MTFKNQKEFLLRMDKKNDLAQRNVKRAMFRVISVVKNRAIQSIATDPKTGPLVTRYNPKRTHQSSAPGEPPATDQGFLVSGFNDDMIIRRGEIIGLVKNSTPYGAPLEFGTVNMAARSFMQPALDESAERVNKIFFDEGVIT